MSKMTAFKQARIYLCSIAPCNRKILKQVTYGCACGTLQCCPIWEPASARASPCHSFAAFLSPSLWIALAPAHKTKRSQFSANLSPSLFSWRCSLKTALQVEKRRPMISANSTCFCPRWHRSWSAALTTSQQKILPCSPTSPGHPILNSRSMNRCKNKAILQSYQFFWQWISSRARSQQKHRGNQKRKTRFCERTSFEFPWWKQRKGHGSSLECRYAWALRIRAPKLPKKRAYLAL